MIPIFFSSIEEAKNQTSIKIYFCIHTVHAHRDFDPSNRIWFIFYCISFPLPHNEWNCQQRKSYNSIDEQR